MLRRFGTWRRRYWLALAMVAVVAGLLLLVRGHFYGSEIAYWQSHAQPCGTIQVFEGHVIAGDPQAAPTCFLQAYAHCRAATLVEEVQNLDVPPTYTYLVEPSPARGGHACSIQMNRDIGGSDAAQPSNHVWVSCSDVAQRWYGLHFYACGMYGDLFVSVAPLSQSPSGVACGDIHAQIRYFNSTLVDNAAQGIVSCFVQARQTCQQAWVETTVTYPVAQDSLTQPVLAQQTQMLLVEPYRGTCSVLELEWHQYTKFTAYVAPTVCTSLALQEDGLHVAHCERGVTQIVLPICGGKPPEALDTTCARVPQAKQ